MANWTFGRECREIPKEEVRAARQVKLCEKLAGRIEMALVHVDGVIACTYEFCHSRQNTG